MMAWLALLLGGAVIAGAQDGQVDAYADIDGMSWGELARVFEDSIDDLDAVRGGDTGEAPNDASTNDGVAPGQFHFGDNWANFLTQALDPAFPMAGVHLVNRVFVLARELEQDFRAETFTGKTFIDVGSGSGLISLAALTLNASRVISIDAQAASVKTTRRLRRTWQRLGLLHADWEIHQGSVLDEDFMESLHKGDYVYSYGVLHHIGDVWAGLNNMPRLVNPGGRLFIAIHSKEEGGTFTDAWVSFKYSFNKLPRWYQEEATVAWLMSELGEECITKQHEQLEGLVDFGRFEKVFACVRRVSTAFSAGRGMDLLTDARDWLGGFPYEWVTTEEVVRFFRNHKRPMKLVSVRHMAVAGFLMVPYEDRSSWYDEKPCGFWWGLDTADLLTEEIISLADFNKECLEREGGDQRPWCVHLAMTLTPTIVDEVKGEHCYAYILQDLAAERVEERPELTMLLQDYDILGWGAKSSDDRFCSGVGGARYRVFNNGLLLFSTGAAGDPRTNGLTYRLLQPKMYERALDLIGKKATQSSTTENFDASRAIDGRMSGDLDLGGCAHTQFDETPWWNVDLGGSYSVRSVVLHGRTDCCSDRMYPFSVWITEADATSYDSGKKCATVQHSHTQFESRQRMALLVPCGILGGKVWVVLEGRQQYLTICEVEVSILRSVE